MKQSSLFRSRGQNKLISKRIHTQRDLPDSDSAEELLIIPLAKKRKQFKGLNFDQQALITPVSKPQIKDQIGLICEGAKFSVYRDRNMEDYIQARLLEESQPQYVQIGTKDLEQQIIDQLPKEILEIDPRANDKEMAEKPIQWVEGMMEVPIDPESRLKTIELMIQEQVGVDRKVISRGPRGNFKGPFNTRKGEYSQMIKTLNFNHRESKVDEPSSDKPRKESDTFQQNQMNDNI